MTLNVRTLLADNGPYSIVKTWYVDGTATDVGAVTVGIIDANGDEVVASGTATTNNSDGTYTYSLANQADLDVLYLTFTRSDTSAFQTSRIDVIGNLLFTEAQARSARITGLQAPLSDASAYDDELLAEWRDRIAEQFEDKAGHSFIRRYCRLELTGRGTHKLAVWDGEARTSVGDEVGGQGRFSPRKILAASVGGTAITASNVKIQGGQFIRTDGLWTPATSADPFNVVIEYEYGDHPVSIEAREKALEFLLHNAVPSDLAGSALSWSNEDGSFSRDTSGWAYPTAVYEFLKRRDERLPIA